MQRLRIPGFTAIAPTRHPLPVTAGCAPRGHGGIAADEVDGSTPAIPSAGERDRQWVDQEFEEYFPDAG